MKLETLPDLYFVLAVFVPGFIYWGTLRQFVPTNESAQKDTVLVKLLTATSFNYAICSPLIYLLFTDFVPSIAKMIIWTFVTLFAPIGLAVTYAWLVQRDRWGWVFRKLKLRSINPVPTGWDWVFGRIDPCFVLITLRDGTEIAGYFGPKSLASSDLSRRDIFIETVYTIPKDGTSWVPVAASLGMHIDGGQITVVEFRKAGDG